MSSVRFDEIFLRNSGRVEAPSEMAAAAEVEFAAQDDRVELLAGQKWTAAQARKLVASRAQAAADAAAERLAQGNLTEAGEPDDDAGINGREWRRVTASGAWRGGGPRYLAHKQVGYPLTDRRRRLNAAATQYCDVRERVTWQAGLGGPRGR